MSIRRMLARLRALAFRRRLDDELDGEILAHLELAEKDAVAAGESPEQARATARRRFGGIEPMKEEHRDGRGVAWLANMAADFRYGIRGLARDRAFTTIAASVLTLGIGSTVAMFSLLDAVLLKPLPFPDPDRIVQVWEAPRPGVTNATSTLDFLDWQRMATGFEALAASQPVSAALTGAGEPLRLTGLQVTADYFRVFATGTLLGRTFAEGDDQPGATPSVILSHAAWRSHFGADPHILDRRVMLDGEPHQVIGVLPSGAFDRDRPQFWKALVFTPGQRLRDSHWLGVQGRLREGISLVQAREQMAAIDAALAAVQPVWKHDWSIAVDPIAKLLVGERTRRTIWVAFGAVFIVLLIACANVANLLLARGATRTKEMAVRSALGASRGRMLAQLLTECVVLCLLGGVAGLCLAAALIGVGTRFLSRAIPYTASPELDVRAVAFAAAIVFAVALLAGAFPAIRVSAGSLSQSLGAAARGSSGEHQRVRRLIVVGEVALSLVMVCGAILLLRSFANLQRVDTGVRIEHVVTMALDLPVKDYPSPAAAAAFYQAAAERIRAVPAVAQSALSTHLPLLWIGNGEGMRAPGTPAPVNVRFKRVDAGYFETFAIPVLAGRGISAADQSGSARVVVINEALAKRLADTAGMNDPVGRHVLLGCPRYSEKGVVEQEVEIAGIVRNERVSSPGAPTPAVAYVPLAQVPAMEVKLSVRTQIEPAAVVAGIRAALRDVDPNLPLGDVATMDEVRARTLSGASQPAQLIGAFAGLAALLAAIGLYGVLTQTVAQRRREIGIRMALGAQRRDVVRQVVRDAMAMVVLGLAVGFCGALALTRVMQGLLYEVSPFDPTAVSIAGVLMIMTGLAAGLVPASRASRVDPSTTLREDG